MPLARALHLLPLGFLCASLAGQESTPKPAGNPADQKTETAAPQRVETPPTKTKVDASCANQVCNSRHRRFHRGHFGHHSTFGAYAQGVMPLRDLREDLDKRTGYGLGVQWTHDHGDWHASRTRLEWNTFPEGGSAAGPRTYAKNYVLSWDHLFKLNQGRSQAYLVAGIGGSRWYLEQTTAGLRDARWTTKLAITGGAGLQVAARVNLEARYVVGSINQTFDANTLQMSLGWRF